MVPFGQWAVLRRTHDAAHMTGREEPVDPRRRRGHQRLDRLRYEHVAHQHREVDQPSLTGLEDRHRIRRGRGLETDAEEHDLFVGVLVRERNCIERRIDDAHIAATGLHREQIVAAARHAQHVAEGGEDHVRASGDRERAVDHLQRGDTHRATRPVDQLDLISQQLIDAVANDGVRLTTADLHDRPRPCGRSGDLLDQRPSQHRVVELVEVLHPRSPSSANSRNVSSADSSSSRVIAKPAWTIV